MSVSAYGIIAHELGHAFGIKHNKWGRNRKGIFMWNGCRGMRGYFQPDLTEDFCKLSKKNAKILNNNPFFAVRELKPKSSAFSTH